MISRGNKSAAKIMNPIGRLMGLRYKSYLWHGIDIGDAAPQEVASFIEMVPTDTVKYKVDKRSGYLMIDRPQKCSNVIPVLYGFISQIYCGKRVGEYCMNKVGRDNINGDKAGKKRFLIYGQDEAKEVIAAAIEDYSGWLDNIHDELFHV